MKFEKLEVLTTEYMDGILFCTNDEKEKVIYYEWARSIRSPKHSLFGIPYEGSANIEHKTVYFMRNGALEDYISSIEEED